EARRQAGERDETTDVTLDLVLAARNSVEGAHPALTEIVQPRSRPCDGGEQGVTVCWIDTELLTRRLPGDTLASDCVRQRRPGQWQNCCCGTLGNTALPLDVRRGCGHGRCIRCGGSKRQLDVAGMKHDALDMPGNEITIADHDRRLSFARSRSSVALR